MGVFTQACSHRNETLKTFPQPGVILFDDFCHGITQSFWLQQIQVLSNVIATRKPAIDGINNQTWLAKPVEQDQTNKG